jgi:transposase
MEQQLKQRRGIAMKNRNIYSNQSKELIGLFEDAGNPTRIMCVPIDFAKKDHIAMFCNGHGNILHKPFPIKNSPEGVKYLIERMKRTCNHRGILSQHIFIGGEDNSSYADNFIHALRAKGYIVANVNAHDAKKQRDNIQASTDLLDLLGIAKMLLSRRAKCFPAQAGIYLNLRTLVRHRAKLVVLSTEVKNQVHTSVDRLFPCFLNEKKSGITPFSKGSLWLMEDRFSARQISRRKRTTLIDSLKRRGINNPEIKVHQLQQFAANVLNPPSDHIITMQISLGQHVKHYRCLKENIETLEREIAILLAQTQGAFLTSIKGIGLVLAAGLTSEIGDPTRQMPVRNLSSYSGIIPRIKQTGGLSGNTYTGKVSRRCNRILKNYVVQSASHMGKHGPAELMADYKRRDSCGQHANFGIARKYLRVAMCLMKTSQIYLPKHLKKFDTKKEERAEYYKMIWPYLREKWRKAGAVDTVFREDNPLGEWRKIVETIYSIKLTV